MHLEVQVIRSALSVARVADEAEHVAGLDPGAVLSEGRVRREVGVVVLVPLPVPKPQPPPSDLVPARREDGAVRHGEDRSSERGEDVVAVVPPGCRARGAEVVREGRRSIHGKDVTLSGDVWDHTRRRVAHDLGRLRCSAGGLALGLVRQLRGSSRRRPSLTRGLLWRATVTHPRLHSSRSTAAVRRRRSCRRSRRARSSFRVTEEKLRAGRKAAVLLRQDERGHR